jgi:putative membrane protein
MLLTLIAAPLIVLGFEKRVDDPTRTTDSRWIKVDFPGSTVLFAASIWIWHWPGPYDATLQNNYIYWLMHITTFGSALWLWKALLNSSREHAGSALVAGFITAMQMTLLGALFTFATHSLFIVHLGTTDAWHLSQIEDQQLGGLIMWVIGGLLFTTYAIGAFALLLHRAGETRSACTQPLSLLRPPAAGRGYV